MASPEPMTWGEIGERFDKIRRDTGHIKRLLPKGNPYNAVLRIMDVCDYAHIPYTSLMDIVARGKRDQLLGAEKRRRMTGRNHLQQQLSNFFRQWDQGILIKACIDDEWKIVHRHNDPGLAQMAPAPKPEAKVIPMTIDRSTFGLKVGR